MVSEDNILVRNLFSTTLKMAIVQLIERDFWLGLSITTLHG